MHITAGKKKDLKRTETHLLKIQSKSLAKRLSQQHKPAQHKTDY
jgi:hypothetical protein